MNTKTLVTASLLGLVALAPVASAAPHGHATYVLCPYLGNLSPGDTNPVCLGEEADEATCYGGGEGEVCSARGTLCDEVLNPSLPLYVLCFQPSTTYLYTEVLEHHEVKVCSAGGNGAELAESAPGNDLFEFLDIEVTGDNPSSGAHSNDECYGT
jgi:hypothetical protein